MQLAFHVDYRLLLYLRYESQDAHLAIKQIALVPFLLQPSQHQLHFQSIDYDRPQEKKIGNSDLEALLKAASSIECAQPMISSK